MFGVRIVIDWCGLVEGVEKMGGSTKNIFSSQPPQQSTHLSIGILTKTPSSSQINPLTLLQHYYP